MEIERHTGQMSRVVEGGLVALCTVSLLVYLLQSRAAAKYVALYVEIIGKVFMAF